MAVWPLDQRVAVVIGVGHGLGRVTARSLTGRGARALTGLRTAMTTRAFVGSRHAFGAVIEVNTGLHL
jgi:NAD(P)-dependent dehydrogenase (short-subunit alcohol dehydrogenase family)